MMRRGEWMLLGAFVALAACLVAAWRPARGMRQQSLENKVERALAARDVQLSPAELATLMHNRMVSLVLLDLRDEASFNAFHLIDARRIAPETSTLTALRTLPERTLKVLVDEDERIATAAYRTAALAGTKQLYLLAGGLRAWLALFDHHDKDPGVSAVLAGALGSRHPASAPDLDHIKLPKFTPKAKLGFASAKKSGGCGG